MNIATTPHMITVREYLRMGEACVFAPEARLELIEGGILEMAPIGSRHAGAVNVLNRLLVQRVGDTAIVAIQNPLVIGDFSVPQPDVLLLNPRADNYSTSHPTPADVLLLIEVSDTTLSFDLQTKVPLYARHGVPEVWIADLNDRVIRVFRDLAATGYRMRLVASGNETISPLALPGVVIATSDIFSNTMDH